MTFGNDSLVWSISADYSVFTRGFFSSFINELSRLETAHTLLFVASEIFSWSTQTVNNAAVQICITIFAHEQKSSENFVRWFTLLCIFREKTINSQRIGKLFQVSFFSIGTIVFFFLLLQLQDSSVYSRNSEEAVLDSFIYFFLYAVM